MHSRTIAFDHRVILKSEEAEADGHMGQRKHSTRREGRNSTSKDTEDIDADADTNRTPPRALIERDHATHHHRHSHLTSIAPLLLLLLTHPPST